MMSKKQWFVLFCFYIIYLLLGAAVFWTVENREEFLKKEEKKRERIEIEILLNEHYEPSEEEAKEDIFDKIATYCDRPLSKNMTDVDDPVLWDYYHSVFFVITVVSTIGYGNLAPTVTLTRIFMIFYGLVGIPLNGVVMVTLGQFFGRSFIKLYQRWKTSRMQDDLAMVGLVGQIILYLVPGFTFFIFLPATLIMVYEMWPYDQAVYYAFVTLTTIGFGDIVAGTKQYDHSDETFMAYKLFLLCWIVIGLGYGVMVINFITQGMHHKRVLALEHKLALNLKKTPRKIQSELRSLMNEFLLNRVKRVYKENFIYVPRKCERSQSCPDISLYRNMNSPTMCKKRALSLGINNYEEELPRIQSDSDLQKIDKELTFQPSSALVEPSKLLLRVVDALGGALDSKSLAEDEGIQGFSDSDILASEKNNSGWSIGSQKISAIPPRLMRERAASEVKMPFKENNLDDNNLTWYGPAATQKLQELRQRVRHGSIQEQTLPQQQPQHLRQRQKLFSKLKNTFLPSREQEKGKSIDLEGQNYAENATGRRISCVSEQGSSRQLGRRRGSSIGPREDQVLEETITDFIHALMAINVPEDAEGENEGRKRKKSIAMGTPLSQSPRTRRLPIRPSFMSRRTSLMPPSPRLERRRFSVIPQPSSIERRDLFAPPPPYTPRPQDIHMASGPLANNRRYSLRPAPASVAPSPVQRHMLWMRPEFMQDTNPRNGRKRSNSNDFKESYTP